jgi:hypothetical protein
MHASIPTTYRSTRFRSRLEARWACWFDLKQNVRWQYEPFDLKGYIPDFVLECDGVAPIVAEIKPVTTLESFVNSRDGSKTYTALFNDPWFINGYAAFFVLGISPAHCWGYYVETAKWRQLPDSDAAHHNWKLAGNVVQWKAPR